MLKGGRQERGHCKESKEQKTQREKESSKHPESAVTAVEESSFAPPTSLSHHSKARAHVLCQKMPSSHSRIIHKNQKEEAAHGVQQGWMDKHVRRTPAMARNRAQEGVRS